MKDAAAVVRLAAIQEARRLPDSDFARVVRLEYSGSSWGKMKAGTWSGNAEKALAAVKRSLALATSGRAMQSEGEVVLFDHVQEAIDAVEIARGARDEHRLVVIAGHSGSGKSVTGRLLAERFGGEHIHAHPSWAGSYLRCLVEIGRGLGLPGEHRACGVAERAILDALAASPRLIVIDEANHFTRDGLNFLKTLINETRCAVVLCTLPSHLARLAAEHAEESRQLIRRAVAIVHIPPVTSEDVIALHRVLAPEVELGSSTLALASLANKHHRLDTVARVLAHADAADAEDLPRAIQRVERMIKIAA